MYLAMIKGIVLGVSFLLLPSLTQLNDHTDVFSYTSSRCAASRYVNLVHGCLYDKVTATLKSKEIYPVQL